jgi:hypothetical protein
MRAAQPCGWPVERVGCERAKKSFPINHLGVIIAQGGRFDGLKRMH